MMNRQGPPLFEAPLAHEVADFSHPELELEWETHKGSHHSSLLDRVDWEVQSLVCPKPTRITISRFPVHQQSVATLPKEERDKIAQIADMVVRSFRPGCSPITWILMVGHADKDTPRRPSFEKVISGERVLEVQRALNIAINRRQRDLTRKVALVMRRVGADEPVPNNTNRALNRRVSIFMVPGQPPPPAPPRVILGQVVQRSLALLQTRPIRNDRTGNRTKRIQCVLRMIQNAGVEDGYFNGYDWQIRSNGNIGRLTPAQLAGFLSSVRRDLTKPWMDSSAPDDDILAELERLDARIWFGIANINRHIELNGAAADIAKKQMKSFISQQQQNKNSIYWCYGAGQ